VPIIGNRNRDGGRDGSLPPKKFFIGDIMKSPSNNLTIIENIMIGLVSLGIIIIAIVMRIYITYESIANYFREKNEK